MVSESPPFWWEKADWRAWLLSPAALVYGLVAGRRMRKHQGAPVAVPVICVGNFTVGGAGKTPTALALAQAAKKKGLTPGLLSRGYGGSIDRTTMVDPDHHRARDVGDEPLLLAREALTVVSRNRVEGAAMLISQGANIIIMDDGFQSARLAFDYALLVIDSRRGIGNGFIVPAGPVRAPISVQLARATALLKVGEGNQADPFVRRSARAGKPVYFAEIVAKPDADWPGSKVLAFAGIADPEKFYRTVSQLGMDVVARRSYADHHHLSDDEIEDILKTAKASDLMIVTTAKDHVRLAGHHGKAQELAEKAKVVEVEMKFDSPLALGQIIDQAIETKRRRRLENPVAAKE